MNFSQALNPKLIKVNLKSTEKDELFEEMAELLVENYPNIDKSALVSALWERERQMSTGIMTNVAIPHCKLAGVDDSIVCIGVSKDGIDYGSLDAEPVFLVVLIVASPNGSESHLGLLKNIAIIADDDDFFDELVELKTSEEVYDHLINFELEIRE